MAENLSNNPGSANAGEKKVEATQLSLTERVDKYYVEKNAWKNMNGGCAISADLEETLLRLREAVKPRQEDLPGMLRAAIDSYAVEGQTIEQIWAQKIVEGANFIGVINGIFGFYKGEEQLVVNTKPLKISGLPVILEYRREVMKTAIQQAKAEVLKSYEKTPEEVKPKNLGEGGIAEGATGSV